MPNYFVLQENDESAAYAFKVSFDGYKVRSHRNQRDQYTTTGKLDVQVGPNENNWTYIVKLTGETSGLDPFAVSGGSIMTAVSVAWGDRDDLVALFARVIPPSNKLRFRDVDGTEHYVYFTGELTPRLLTPEPSGQDSYQLIQISLRGST